MVRLEIQQGVSTGDRRDQVVLRQIVLAEMGGGPHNLTSLSEATGVARASLARAVNRLVTAGLVRIERQRRTTWMRLGDAEWAAVNLIMDPVIDDLLATARGIENLSRND